MENRRQIITYVLNWVGGDKVMVERLPKNVSEGKKCSKCNVGLHKNLERLRNVEKIPLIL